MKVVLVLFKDGQRREFPLNGTVTIGRREDAKLRIPTPDVSRQHCELKIEGESLVVRDLGSSNGTLVNGQKAMMQKLKAGDLLTVGPAQFIVQIDGKPADINPPPPPKKTAKVKTGSDEETEEILDLNELGLEDDDDASDFDIDALLDDDDEDDAGPPKKGAAPKKGPGKGPDKGPPPKKK